MPSPLAGTLPAPDKLPDIPALLAAYADLQPEAGNPAHKVSFGTSGHRGCSLKRTFNEAHILAITQAVCDIRKANGVNGPLFIGKDTHALSAPATQTALQVLTANGVTVFVEERSPFTPTPVVSHAILAYNRTAKDAAQADGIIVTPSHNPPTDGGFKYNPPTGGPAPSSLTSQIEKRANELLAAGNKGVLRLTDKEAEASGLIRKEDFIGTYIRELPSVLDLEAIAASGLRIGAEPLGGSTLDVWGRLAETYKRPIEVVSRENDPTFRFVPLDHDGKIRMDCSSRFAMSALLRLKDQYDLAFACDPDADRHGIIAQSGLMNPNHYLSAVAWHLFQSRKEWPASAGIGKTVVTSSMLNRVAKALGRKIVEVPVGFKWFVPYLFDASCGMGCEESAGASFLCFDGAPWSTDKDGPLLCLLAAEMMAKHGKSPAVLYKELTERFGTPAYSRVDSPLEPEKRALFAGLSADKLPSSTLAGDAIESAITKAPANDASIGGIKVSTANGWFAARPSGTEPICKVYTESFLGEDHRKKIESDAITMLDAMLK